MMPLPLLVLLLLPQNAEELTLIDYQRKLTSLRDAFQKGEIQQGQREAKALRNKLVRVEYETFPTDETVLGPLSRNDQTPDPDALARLDRMIDALPAERLEEAGLPRRNETALRDIRKEQALNGPEEGGHVPPPNLDQISFLEGVFHRIGDILGWIKEVINNILEWLLRLIFGKPQSEGGVGMTGTRILVILLIIAIVAILCVVVAMVLRNSRGKQRSTETPTSLPAVSQSADANPLSRSTSEWEKYAQQLIAAGRFREAVRAWYHAALVNLYRAGLLHYRKDRTNWEYAYSLPPDLPWRPLFVDATRDFEREWYGRKNTSREMVQNFGGEVQKILQQIQGRTPV